MTIVATDSDQSWNDREATGPEIQKSKQTFSGWDAISISSAPVTRLLWALLSEIEKFRVEFKWNMGDY